MGTTRNTYTSETVRNLVLQGYEVTAGQDKGEHKYMLLESARADAFAVLRAPLGASKWCIVFSGELRRANDKWAEVLDEAHLPRGRQGSKRGDRRSA